MSTAKPSELPIATRAYAAGSEFALSRSKKSRRKPSAYTLILDTETTTDPAQRLRFGCYQVRKHGDLIDSGFFYDNGALDEREQSLLQRHASLQGVKSLPLADFIEQVFFHYTYDLGGLCVGFNLPFDLSRIASSQATAKSKAMRGGFTFLLSGNRWRPRLQIKHLRASDALLSGSQHQGSSARREVCATANLLCRHIGATS